MNAHFESLNGFAEADDDTLLDYRVDDDSFDGGFDESYAEDDDSSESDDDSAEFLGGMLAKGIGTALNTVNRIVRPTIKGASKLSIPTPNLSGAVTNGISAVSNLMGRITSPSGKQVQFRLPSNTATKGDIAALKRAVDANTKAIRINSAAIKKEAEAIVSLRKDMKEIDTKHIAATKKQNEIMEAINGRVSKLKKDLEKTKQDAQTQQMLSLLMQPKLKSLTFDAAPAAGTAVNVTQSKFEDNNLFMMLALSGGLNDSSSNSMLPLIFLMK